MEETASELRQSLTEEEMDQALQEITEVESEISSAEEVKAFLNALNVINNYAGQNEDNNLARKLAALSLATYDRGWHNF